MLLSIFLRRSQFHYGQYFELFQFIKRRWRYKGFIDEAKIICMEAKQGTVQFDNTLFILQNIFADHPSCHFNFFNYFNYFYFFVFIMVRIARPHAKWQKSYHNHIYLHWLLFHLAYWCGLASNSNFISYSRWRSQDYNLIWPRPPPI